MAEVKNAFIKSKMNKDLDARLIPSGEYRNAINAQVSKSEGSDVGALENALGNELVRSLEVTIANIECIGYFADNYSDNIYIFLTDYSGSGYSTTANNFIYQINVIKGNTAPKKLVQGNFLNFSKLSPIYGINLLEDLLFFTDNRNQPRKINVSLANKTGAVNPTYYNTEDNISVAKYNPFQSMQLFEASAAPLVDKYETTMKDVVSKFLPNGGTASTTQVETSASFITIADLEIELYQGPSPQGTYINAPTVGMKVKYIRSDGAIVDFATPVTVKTWDPNTNILELSSAITTTDTPVVLVFNPNPYYDKTFNGDPQFLEDKFVRFSYRFKFDDGEYSIIAPFTQSCFIPKQDGYFINTSEKLGDMQQTYDSTIVSFMENKVNKIDLIIPLPTAANNLASSLHITELDILYKESDALALQVVTSIPASDITGTDKTYKYSYQSQKPYKTLPEREITRVYDKVPVKALSQEIISNRVVYGNYQDKHTPPAFLNYNASATIKSDFDLFDGAAVVNGAVSSSTTIVLKDIAATSTIVAGSIVTGGGLQTSPPIVVVTSAGTNPTSTITTNIAVTLANLAALSFEPANSESNTTSKIEYPSSSLKTNRNYQVGIVLSDRFGRQSTTILSNSTTVQTINGITYTGATLYSPYIDSGINVPSWPGNSLKILINDPIGPTNPVATTSSPGLYNGDIASNSYNPLGWYSYKVVVKQTEQEYYNVYTAGAIKGSPEYSTALPENRNNSFVTLINDNINKVPRDLSEVGPQDKTFRSSVQLFGRVQNIIGNPLDGLIENINNVQYYPGIRSFTTSSIEDLFDLFDVDQATSARIPITSVRNPYSSFFRAQSDPFVGEIVTSQTSSNQFGVINTAESTVGGGDVNGAVSNNAEIVCNNISGSIEVGSVLSYTGIPVSEDDIVVLEITGTGTDRTITLDTAVTIGNGISLVFTLKEYKKVEALAILETEPVESRLDIFWESSTAGLVADLNNAILDDSNGGAGFSDFNSSVFNEGIQSGADILNSDFQLVDNFQSNIPVANIDFFRLNSVQNGNGQEVFTSATNAGRYFSLIEQGAGTFIYNIETTDAFINSTGSFFGTDDLARTFVFYFESKTTNQATPPVEVTTLYTETVTLNNLAPVITAPAGVTPAINYTINPSIDAVALDTFTATNGAFKGSPEPQNPRRGRELTWTMSAVNSAGASVSFFNIGITSADTISTCALTCNTPTTLPADLYTLNIKVTDAGLATDSFVLTINYFTVPTLASDRYLSFLEDGSDQPDEFPYAIFKIEGAALLPNNDNPNGFYIYNGNGEGFSTWDKIVEEAGGGNIRIDYTNARKTPGQCEFTNSSPWYFSAASTEGAITTFWEDCETLGSSGQAQGTSTNTIDITGYNFVIV